MPFSITKDIRTVSDLKKKTNEIFKQIHRTGRPIIVTVNGKPDVVLIDVEIFEKKTRALNLASLISPAEHEVKEGRTRPARAFIKEFKGRAKVSR